MAIKFRPATIDDLALLKHWDAQPHVIASDPNEDNYWEWETELKRSPDWREQLIAELDGRPIGFMQIMDPARDDEHYWGKDVPENLRALDIWIGEKEDLSKGYGSQMMKLALEKCFADPKVTAVLVDPIAANKRAHKFYEKCGFKFVEKRQFGDDECLVYELKRDSYFKNLT